MDDDLKYQLRVTLSDSASETARSDPGAASLGELTAILNRHNAALVCQFDAFAGYVAEAEKEGIDDYPLYAWTKETIENAKKKEKYLKSFTLYVNGDQVYEKTLADSLEAELRPLEGGPIVKDMKRYDTNPANNPQPPKRFREKR